MSIQEQHLLLTFGYLEKESESWSAQLLWLTLY